MPTRELVLQLVSKAHSGLAAYLLIEIRVRNLALQYPKSSFRNGPLLVYLTARNNDRGRQAIKDVQSDADFKRAKVLAEDGGQTTVQYHQLDISDSSSIHAFGSFLKKEHPHGIDFVINNAGIAMNGFDGNVVKETLKCNYYGTLEATRIFLPLIKDGGRLVNVSSIVGELRKYPANLRSQFLAADTVDKMTSLMEQFKEAVKDGKEEEQGWPRAAYAVSKAGCTGMTKVIAIEEKQKGSKTLINACCPGYVATDMSKGNGTKTPDQGAQTPVLLALGDIGQQTGLFWQEERPIEW